MENKFKTDDIFIASFLLTQKERLFNLASDTSRHFTFVFENSENCERLAWEYLNNASAPARELFARREELITAMRHRNGNNYGSGHR